MQRPVEGVPVNVPDSAAAGLRALTTIEEDRFKLALSVAGEYELRRLGEVGLAAQSEVRRSAKLAVDASLAERLPPALAAFIAKSTAVEALSREVEKAVESHASGVVRRLASEEVARHSLASAVEERCMARIDERLRGVTYQAMAVGALGGAAAAAVALAAARR
jgi:hypothetical protein